MEAFKTKQPIYPLFGFIVAILTLVLGLFYVSAPHIIWFFCLIYLLHIIFGNYRACIGIIPFLILMGGFLGGTTFFVSQNMESTNEAIFRSVAICLAIIPGLSMETTHLIKNLRQIHMPKGITLGMLITLNFMPLLRKEMHQIREAMKTRGAVSIWNPTVVYRGFLIPLIIRIVNISESLSLSVESRGFTLEMTPTTVYEPIEITIRDILFLCIFITFAIGVIIL